MALVKCPECEKEVSSEAVSCPNCGYPLKGANAGPSQNQRLNETNTTIGDAVEIGKPKKKKGCLLKIVIFMLVIYGIGIILFIITSKENGNSVNDTSSDFVIDVNQFSNISTDELVELMGEPEDTESWDFDTAVGTFPTVRYTYENGRYEFLEIDNKIVRVTINSPKYNALDAESFTYKNTDDLFSMFGIEESEDYIKITTADSALRLQRLTDDIDEFFIPSIDLASNSFDMVQITFDQMYFGNLNLTTEAKNQYQYLCEEGIKSILVSPSTADFPNITEWKMWECMEGTIIQAYVDSQNSFGAEIRTEFQFIFDGLEVTSLIVNGEELINN